MNKTKNNFWLGFAQGALLAWGLWISCIVYYDILLKTLKLILWIIK